MYKTDYQLVAASQTKKILGNQQQVPGSTNLYGEIETIVIIPATTSPGAVQLFDGTGSAITIFTGGATSVADLKPIYMKLGIRATGGAWQVTTGTNVSVFCTGRFP